MDFEAAGVTDKGQVRELNEDAILVDCDRGLFAVADGCGGHAAGEVASSQVVATLSERAPLLGAGKDPSTTDVAGHRLLLDQLGEAVHHASLTIYERSQAAPHLLGMATTATVLLLRGGHGYVAHVGDTRLYRLRAGQLAQLTEDHTLAAEMVKRGVLQPDEIRTWAYRNALQRALGHHQRIAIDTLLFDVQVADVLLLCSDGLHGMMEDPAICQHLCEADPDGPRRAQALADRLVQAANQLGGMDNVSAVVVRCLGPVSGVAEAAGVAGEPGA